MELVTDIGSEFRGECVDRHRIRRNHKARDNAETHRVFDCVKALQHDARMVRRSGRVKLGFEVDAAIPVYRLEIWERMHAIGECPPE